MGFHVTCDRCHKVINNRRSLTVGGLYTSTIYLHPECGPEVVRLLKRLKVEGIDELIASPMPTQRKKTRERSR